MPNPRPNPRGTRIKENPPTETRINRQRKEKSKRKVEFFSIREPLEKSNPLKKAVDRKAMKTLKKKRPRTHLQNKEAARKGQYLQHERGHHPLNRVTVTESSCERTLKKQEGL